MLELSAVDQACWDQPIVLSGSLGCYVDRQFVTTVGDCEVPMKRDLYLFFSC